MRGQKLREKLTHVSAGQQRFAETVSFLSYLAIVLTQVGQVASIKTFIVYALFCFLMIFAINKVKEHFLLWINERRSGKESSLDDDIDDSNTEGDQ